MSEQQTTARRIAKIAVLDIAIFLAANVYFSTAFHLAALRINPDAVWLDQFTGYLPTWGAFAVLSPGLFWLAKHQRIGLRRGLLPVLVHFGVSLVWVVLVAGTWVVVDLLRVSEQPASLYKIVSSRLLMVLLDYQWYWLVAAAAHAYHGTRDAITRARETATLQLENAQLERRLARAELDALKAQLHPHFLFNTHHAIAGLIRSDKPRAALEMIADLSGMLRYALETEEHVTVMLARELEFTRRFLAIQALRFGDRLEVEWDVSPNCGRVLVPPLILQPLIENAVHHGVSADRAENFVRVRARMENEALDLEIRNSMLENNDDRAGFGIGLKNVHGRLQHLYGKAYELELELVSANEMRVHMVLPAEPPERMLGPTAEAREGIDDAANPNADRG